MQNQNINNHLILSFLFSSSNWGMKYDKLSLIPKSEKADKRVMILMIQYNIPTSDTLKSFDISIFIMYAIGAIIKLSRYSQKPFFKNFSDNDVCASIK